MDFVKINFLRSLRMPKSPPLFTLCVYKNTLFVLAYLRVKLTYLNENPERKAERITDYIFQDCSSIC